MEHASPITEFVNRLLGHPVAALLAAIGIKPENPEMPIPEFFIMGVLVCLMLGAFVLWLKPRLSVDNPGASQQVIELLLTNPIGFGIRDLLDNNVGHGGRKFVAEVGTISVFILCSNLFSVIPVFSSPTGHPSVPLACALVTFLFFNYQGVRAHGVLGYLKHFAGDTWWLSPLIFPVEIVSTSARILSLTIRLWANMYSSELLYFIFLGLFMGPSMHFMDKAPVLGWVLGIFPAILPVAFIALHVFVAVIQSFVFTILPAIYLGMATAHEH